MVYESEFYTTRRPYSSSLSRPTISSYSVTPHFDRVYSYDDSLYNYNYNYNNYYTPRSFTSGFSRIGYNSFLNRAPIGYSYSSSYQSVPFHGYSRMIPVPMTRITTSPTRIYRDRSSPVRMLTSSSHIYRRDVSSPVRVITSPARIVSIRVRPSVMSREFGRIEHKYRPSTARTNATENYLNSSYSTNFDDETREIRESTQRLMKQVREPVPRAQSYSRYGRAQSLQPTYSRFDHDLIDKYGNGLIENEFYVNKNILRPTRKTRDQIEILSKIKYGGDNAKRFTGTSHLASTRIVGDKSYHKRSSLLHDYDYDFTNRRVFNDVNYLSYYSKNRDAVKADDSGQLDPARPSRKFNEPKMMEDPSVALAELAELKAANRLEKSKEVDDIDLEKVKQQRLEAMRLREEQAALEEKTRKAEEAKKEEANRQAELVRQERMAQEAAAERQAEMDRKAEEARIEEEAAAQKQAEEDRIAAGAAAAELAAKQAEEANATAAKEAEEAKLAEEARVAEEAKKAEEARVAEEARAAEEHRLAELEKVQAEESRLAELEQLAKDEEEVELARQANELAEMARQQAEELIAEAPVVEESTPEVEEEAPVVDEAPIVEEAPETPIEEEAPTVEEPVVEEPAVEEEAVVEEATVEEPEVEESVADE